MILTLPDIVDVLKTNPGAVMLREAREYNKRLRLHMYGEGMEEELANIKGFERDHVADLRRKYAKSNKDLFTRLSRPLDKIFTAKGGSVYLNLPDQQSSRAAALAQSLPGDLSVRQWVQRHWMPHMLDDPFGLVFLEILPQREAIKAKQQGRSFVYPTYKPVSCIFDYKPSGNKLEWVVFDLTRQEKQALGVNPDQTHYRVVDDAFDYIIRWDSGTSTALPVDSLTLPNYFAMVPAMLNSDIANPAKEGYLRSLYDEVVELAKQFLLKGSIRSVHDFLHGFPKYSEFASDCHECEGTGYQGGKKCETCGGSGKKSVSSVAEAKLLPFPESGQPVVLPRDAGGYISPDKIYYDISTADLADLETAMHHTVWGVKSAITTSGMAASGDGVKTATEVVDDMKPQADRLAVVSEMAEKRHKFILDAVIRVNLSLPSYKGASVNYGRRYLLEAPDAIWAKYKDARTSGAPQNVLDTLLNEYYDANYQSDPIGLSVAKKLMYVEPFVHYTAQQLQGLGASDEDYKAKLYYGEWLSQVSEAMLIGMDIEELKSNLYSFTQAKSLKTA